MGTLYHLDAAHSHPNNARMGLVIAERVTDWRRKHNAHGERRAPTEREMSQAELAKRAGVSIGCISGVERAVRKTRTTQLAAIANAIGLTLDQLCEGDSEPTPTARPDPRGVDLRDEDYEIARLFRTASTDVKVSVRNQLRADARRQEQPDRHSAPTDTDSRIIQLAERVRQRLTADPEYVTATEQYLKLLDERETPQPATSLQPKTAPTRSA